MAKGNGIVRPLPKEAPVSGDDKITTVKRTLSPIIDAQKNRERNRKRENVFMRADIFFEGESKLRRIRSA